MDSVVLLVPLVGFPGALITKVIERFTFERTPFVVAAPEPGELLAADGVHLTARLGLDEPLLHDMAALVVFDSPSANLILDVRALSLIRALREAGRLVAAVGGGVRTLAHAGVVRGSEVACTRDMADEIARAGGMPVLAPLVSAPGLLTATAAGIRAFADTLVEFRGVAAQAP